MSQTNTGGNNNNNNNDDDDDDESALNWIKKAMAETAGTQGSTGLPQEDGLMIRPTREGLSGFAVDRDLGFVAVLTSANQKSTFCVVSPSDTQQLQSAQAMTLVQLAGGMDLGTAVLPPDVLAKTVAEELDDDEIENDDGKRRFTSESIRQRLSLLTVKALPNAQYNPDAEENPNNHQVPPASTAERDAKLVMDIPKLLQAVRKLPGLQSVQEEDIFLVMKHHADSQGNIDRDAFTNILDMLRRKLSFASTVQQQQQARVVFELGVALDDVELQRPIPVSSSMVALGLALRYAVPIQVSEDCIEMMESWEITTRFSKYRPIEELEEDARIMDGFIPSMFAKATAPKNDDKA